MKRTLWTVLMLCAVAMLCGCPSLQKSTTSKITDAGRALAEDSGDRTAEGRIEARTATPMLTSTLETDNAPAARVPPSERVSRVLLVEGDDVVVVGKALDTWNRRAEVQGPRREETSTSQKPQDKPPAGPSAFQSPWFWLKIGGALCLIAAAVLWLWFHMNAIAGIVGTIGACALGIGVFMDKIEDINAGWYAAGAALVLVVVFCVLFLKYKSWFLTLGRQIMSVEATEVAVANKQALPKGDQEAQKKVLAKAGALIPAEKKGV